MADVRMSLVERLCDGDRHDPAERGRYTVLELEELVELADSEEKKVSL